MGRDRVPKFFINGVYLIIYEDKIFSFYYGPYKDFALSKFVLFAVTVKTTSIAIKKNIKRFKLAASTNSMNI